MNCTILLWELSDTSVYPAAKAEDTLQNLPDLTHDSSDGLNNYNFKLL